MLAQQVSDFNVERWNFHIKEKAMQKEQNEPRPLKLA